MDFWRTDDSSTWQEESWSQNLHESLFKSCESKKQTTKKSKKRDSEVPSIKEKRIQSAEGESICEEEAVPRKKKKKGNAKLQNGGSDDVQNPEMPARKEKFRPKIPAISSETALHDLNEPVTQNSDVSSTEINEVENAVVQSKDKTKKNRKRKPKNNKFKDKTTAGEGENGTDCGHDVQSQITDVKESSVESSEANLSGKERRKLRRKLAKQQLRTEKQEQAEIMDKKMSDESKIDLPSTDDSESKGTDEDDIPDTSNHGDTKSNLILANTRRKTQMKPDVSLKIQMESQLKSSQFRFLNEQLYKVTGDKAKDMFAADASAFLTYHEGFTQQVKQWPSNPVDIFIEVLKKRPASLVVGDFGCGDAKIARSVKQKVHSFDLYPMNKHVTVCDTKKVPLKDGVLDVAVFCLALMGTNWMDYVKEANRVLKTGGLLKVAEVASRFTSPASFLSVMKSLGFQLKTKDVSNKMFYLFDFKKKQVVTAVPAVKGPILKPCLYKKR
ncbi:ribosomal RNA-processing protein 8-like [Strongylocentrotus purpuratus]|uniref:Ribosomal RNA-processing protein 8 n=1 Tax=Strongylocentrotus purpuratus TaxID=7668 RepID=A0A7M7NHG9_STRPU|nr:ribosomal RNA-processing protein 8-like [Strongylocentrotus purpuratus]